MQRLQTDEAFYAAAREKFVDATLDPADLRDRTIDLGRLQGVDRQLAQAERDREYVRGLRGALEFLLKKMREASQRLKDRAGG